MSKKKTLERNVCMTVVAVAVVVLATTATMSIYGT